MSMDHGDPSLVTDQSSADESASDIDKELIQGMINDAPATSISTPLTIAGNNISKRKQSTQAGTSDEQPAAKQLRSASETNDEAFEFVNYIYIYKKDPLKTQKPPSQSNSKINYDLYIEKDPFKFMSNQPFEDYITAIAAMLQCYKSKLILDELKYKQKVPQTLQIHSLTSNLTFTALIKEMHAAKTVNKQIMYIFSLAPMCSASDEAKKFDDTVKPFIVKLEEKFPVDNFPTLFPGQCIYKNTAGYYFDLDPGALSSWASHWAWGTTSEDAPLNNAYFDAKKCLHPLKIPPA
ncbi:hypothetical protein EV421DRAFT_1914718 [Armillaria borealis]|uniref:Uncharacterized protein n=1 Tax=Armillaria borealis TaxID=47425 RepID=A0AA39IF76_9AGAR|nr:hypothetical protein EV421DRAFT_1914718 [Armillaria borealis]